MFELVTIFLLFEPGEIYFNTKFFDLPYFTIVKKKLNKQFRFLNLILWNVFSVGEITPKYIT